MGQFRRAVEPPKSTRRRHGGVAEWLKAPVLKTGNVFMAFVGSNPTSSVGGTSQHTGLTSQMEFAKTAEVQRRGGRVAEGTSLLRKRTLTGTAGSNPALSARRHGNETMEAL